ncbi:MAG: hypothetical protein GY859_38810, partial [Desulfobacterales bacterium]|nr:hypothetical protein [Desulfobacterales bacterium]
SLRELNPEADLLKLKRRYIGDRRRREFVRAMHRMPATLLKAQQLIDYAPEFAELAVYRGAVIRRMARIFEGTTTRAARLLAAVFGLGAAVNLIAALLMIALMLYQHAGRLILSAANPLHRLALQLPPLDVQVWLLLILFVLYAAFLGASLARRFRRRD